MAGPGRPQNLQLLTTALNGTWTFLGRIVTAGTAINNATTATPFSYTPQDPGDGNGQGINFAGTLAGKTLIIEPITSAVRVLPGESVLGMVANPVTVAAGANPGLRFAVGERPTFAMGQTQGWLQIITEGGAAATVLVWELT